MLTWVDGATLAGTGDAVRSKRLSRNGSSVAPREATVGGMTRVAVLVRGVNVGTSNRLTMTDLRGVLTDAGGRDVETILNSGNAVLTAEPHGLAERVEASLRGRLSLDVRVLVRTAAELADVIAANPFPHKVSEPTLLHVAFVEPAPAPDWVERVGRRHGDDELAPGPGVLYLSYAAQSHRSPLVPVVKRYDGVVTARNWATVVRLDERLRGSASASP